MCHQLDKCCRFFYFYCGTLQTILQSMNYIILMLDELKPHYYLLSIKESFIRLASRVCPLITCKNILFLVALRLIGFCVFQFSLELSHEGRSPKSVIGGY